MLLPCYFFLPPLENHKWKFNTGAERYNTSKWRKSDSRNRIVCSWARSECAFWKRSDTHVLPCGHCSISEKTVLPRLRQLWKETTCSHYLHPDCSSAGMRTWLAHLRRIFSLLANSPCAVRPLGLLQWQVPAGAPGGPGEDREAEGPHRLAGEQESLERRERGEFFLPSVCLLVSCPSAEHQQHSLHCSLIRSNCHRCVILILLFILQSNALIAIQARTESGCCSAAAFIRSDSCFIHTSRLGASTLSLSLPRLVVRSWNSPNSGSSLGSAERRQFFYLKGQNIPRHWQTVAVNELGGLKCSFVAVWLRFY